MLCGWLAPGFVSLVVLDVLSLLFGWPLAFWCGCCGLVCLVWVLVGLDFGFAFWGLLDGDSWCYGAYGCRGGLVL